VDISIDRKISLHVYYCKIIQIFKFYFRQHCDIWSMWGRVFLYPGSLQCHPHGWCDRRHMSRGPVLWDGHHHGNRLPRGHIQQRDWPEGKLRVHGLHSRVLLWSHWTYNGNGNMLGRWELSQSDNNHFYISLDILIYFLSHCYFYFVIYI